MHAQCTINVYNNIIHMTLSHNDLSSPLACSVPVSCLKSCCKMFVVHAPLSKMHSLDHLCQTDPHNNIMAVAGRMHDNGRDCQDDLVMMT